MGPGFGGRGFTSSAALSPRPGLLDCSPAPSAPPQRFARFDWLFDAGLALLEKLRPRRRGRPAFTWPPPAGAAEAASPWPAPGAPGAAGAADALGAPDTPGGGSQTEAQAGKAPPGGDLEIELFDVVADAAGGAAERPSLPPVNGAALSANGAANGARPGAANGAHPVSVNGAAPGVNGAHSVSVNGACPGAVHGAANGAHPGAVNGAAPGVNGAHSVSVNGARPGAVHGAANGAHPVSVNGARPGAVNGAHSGAPNSAPLGANGVANGARPVSVNGSRPGVANGVANGARPGAPNGAASGVANGALSGAVHGAAGAEAIGALRAVRQGSRRGVGLRARLGRLGVHAGGLRLGGVVLALMLGAAPGWAQVTVTVTAPAQVSESAGTVTFNIMLGGGSRSDAVTLNWEITGTATQGAAATQGADYSVLSGSGLTIMADGQSGSLAIAADSSDGNVALMLHDDTVEEAAETITLTVTSAPGLTTPDLSAASATATIAANDFQIAPQLRIDAPTPSRLPETASAVFTVTLLNPPAQDVTVRWRVGPDLDPGTPNANVREEFSISMTTQYRSDFGINAATTTSYEGTLTFRHAQREQRKTITIELNDDNHGTRETHESDVEFYDVILSSPMPGTVGLLNTRATGSILAGSDFGATGARDSWEISTSIVGADQMLVTNRNVNVETTTVQEGETVDVKFTVIADPASFSNSANTIAGPRREVIVPFGILMGNFNVGLVIPGSAGNISSAADIRVSGDHVSGVAPGRCLVTATLRMDCLLVNVRIPAGVKGEAGSFTIQIQAVADAVTEGAETVLIASGVAVRPRINVGPTQIVTEDAFFQVLVGRRRAPTYFTIAASSDMPTRTLALAGPASAAESGGALSYTATLSGMQFAAATQVDWAILGSGAAPASAADFADASGNFMWPANNSGPQMITITPTDDMLNESTEQFSVSLSVAPGEAATAGTISTSFTTMLTDDDPVTIRISDAMPAAEGDFADFSIAITGANRSGPLLLSWAVAGLGTTSAADFGDGMAAAFPSGRLSVPAMASGSMLRIPLFMDSASDDNEQFSLTLQSAESVGGDDADAWQNGVLNIARGTATGTIGVGGANRPPTAMGELSAPLLVGGSMAHTQVVSGAFSDPDGDTLSYSAVSSDTAVATANIATGTSTLSIMPLAEGTAEITVTAEDPGGLRALQRFTVQVRAPAMLSIAAAASAAATAEGGTAEFTVSITAAPAMAVSVAYSVGATADAADDDAEAEDFGTGGSSYPGGMVSFAVGETSKSITLTIHDDADIEPQEFYTVTLGTITKDPGDPEPYSLGSANSAQGSIAVSDPVLVSLGDVQVEEGDTGELPLTFTGARPAGNSTLMLAFEELAAGTAVSGTDYSALSSPLALTVTSSSSHNISVSTTENTTPQGSRTLVLRLTGTGNPLFVLAGADADASERSGTLTITDDDVVMVSIVRKAGESGPIAEAGGEATFTVALGGATPAEAVIAPFSVSGTGITAGDYDIAEPALGAEATGGSLTLSATQMSREIRIRASDDSLLEIGEQLEITLGAVSGGGGRITGAGGQASVAITDDESGTAAIVRQDGDGFAEGGAGAAASAIFRITISGVELATAAMVDFAVTGCGSGAGADCTVMPSSGVLEISPAAGMTTAFNDITLMAVDDNLNEAAETIRVEIAAVRPFGSAIAVAAMDAAAEASLADDDSIRVSIETGSAPVNEGDTATFTVRLSGATAGSAAAVTVSYTIGGDVTAGDYIDDTGGSVEIAAGMTTETIRIEIAQDGVAESMTEELRVTLAANPVVGAGGGTVELSSVGSEQSAAVQIAVSVAAPRNFSAAVASSTVDRDSTTGGTQVNEGDTVTFAVSLSGTAPTEDATVAWELRGAETTDYSTGDTSPLTFTPGNWQTPQTVSVTITDDALNEGAETVFLRLRTATGGSGIAMPTASVEITASDPISYAIGADQGNAEAAGAMLTFSVTLSGASGGSAGGAVRIPVQVGAASTATAADDYSISPSELVFAAATMDSAAVFSQDIRVTIAGDSLSEVDETIRIELGTPTTGAGGGVFTATRASAVLTIEDDDDLSIGITGPGAAVAEGGEAVFTLSITGGVPAATLTLGYTLSGAGITAADIESHSSLSGSFDITRAAVEATPAGEVSLVIGIADDTDPEAAETLTVTLDSVTPGAGGGMASASGSDTATIGASDALTVAIARTDSGDLVEGAMGDSGSAVFRVTITGGVSTAEVSVPFSVGGTGITAADYEIEEAGGVAVSTGGGGGTLRIGSGVAMGDITIRALSDNLNEAAETLQITLQTPSGGGGPAPGLGTALASAEIARSDPATLGLQVIVGGGQIRSGGIREGQAAVFRATLSVPSAADVSVNWRALLGRFQNSNRETQTSSNPDFSTAGGVTVSFAAAGESASGTVRIPAGAVSQDFTLTTALDGLKEPFADGNPYNESFTMRFNGGAMVGMGGGDVTHSNPAATAWIQPNAATPRSLTVELAPSTTDRDTATPGVQVDEGDTVSFRISILGAQAGTAAPTSNVTVNYNIRLGGQVTPDWSVTGGGMSDGTLTFTSANWQTAQTISVMITDDMLNEGTESFRLRLLGPAGGGGGGTGVVEDRVFVDIRPSDPVTLSIARTSPVPPADEISEGGTATFRVTQSAASAGPVNFAFSAEVDAQQNTGPSNNAANPDLSAPGAMATMTGGITGMGTIAAGMTTADVVITAVQDGREEMAEDFSVLLSAPTPGAGAGMVSLSATEAQRSASASIAMSGAASRTFTLAGPGGVDPSNVNEGSAAQFTITRTGLPLAGGTSLEITWTAAPAVSTEMNPLNPTEADDLSAATGSVTFSGSDASKTFDITAMADTLNEGTETFTVSITAPNGDWTLGDPVTTTITDDPADEITATLSGGGTVAEGGNASVTVTLGGGTPTDDVVLNYTLGADSDNATVDADPAADLTDSGGGVFTIGASDSGPHTFDIAIAADTRNEDSEVFLVNANSVTSAGAASAAGSPQTFTITDGNDITVNIAAPNPATVNEGASVDFAVTLSGATSGSVAGITVNYTASGTTDTPTDANSGSISIAAGQTMGTITLGIPFSAALDDNSPDETLSVTLGAITVGAGGGVAEAAVSPNNEASVTVNYLPAAHSFAFTSPATSLSEGAAATTYTVARTGPAISGAAGMTLTWAYAAGSPAAAAADFAGGAPSGGTLVFTGTDASKTFMVPAIEDDNLNEAAEQFTLALSIASGDLAAAAAEGGADLPGAVTVTIADNDAITATLSGGGSVAEGSNAAITVALSGGIPTADVVLNYTLGADTDNATVNADLTADLTDSGSGVFTIATTDTAPHIFNIAIADDAINEASEVFLVNAGTVTSAGAISTAGSPQTFTIDDGDDITVSIAPPSPATVEEGASADFAVTLSGATGGSVAGITVNYTVSGTTDTPTDANGGSITIAAGGTMGTITLGIPVSVTLDADSPAEMLRVTLGAITVGAGGGVATAASSPNNAVSVTVSYLSAAHTFAFSSPATSINEGAATTFTVSRTGPAISGGGSITLTWAYAAGSPAPAAADFMGGAVPPGGTLVFTGTDASESFDITAADDALNEAAEQFTLAVSIASGDMAAATAEGGTILPGAITVAIADGDPITATLSGGGTVMEGRNATITVALTGGTPTAAVVLNYTLGADTDNATVDADLTADLTDSGSGVFTIGASDSGPHTFDIAIMDDAINEAPEVFLVNAGTVTSAGAISTAGSPQTFTIDDGDDITVNIAAPNPATVNERESAEFAITLSGATSGSVAGITVNYTVTGVTVAPTDANGGSIAIAAGQTMGTITLGIPTQAFDDNSPDETLRVTLGAITIGAGGGMASAASSPNNAASVTVSYLPAAHSFAFTSPATSLSEGAAATTYTVDRTGPAIGGGGSITLTWAYAAGNPAPAAADFVGGAPSGGTLVFTGTDASESFTIATAEDNLNEANERFTLTLSIASSNMAAANAAGGADLPGAVMVTIADDDAITATLSGGGTVAEGSNAAITVALSGGIPTADVVLNYTLGADTDNATVDADLAADLTDSGNGVFTIATTDTAPHTFNIAIADDAINEAPEVFLVNVGTVTSAGAISAAGSPQTFTIDDGDDITVSIAPPSPATVEEGASVDFAVTLSGATGGSVAGITVNYTVSGTTDTPTDANGSSITIAAGGTTGTITLGIPISMALDADSPDEILSVTLGAITVGAGGGVAAAVPPNNAASVTVSYLSAAHTFAFSSPATSINEGAATTFTVSRTGPAISGGGSITLTWAYAAGSPAPAAADFMGGAVPAGGTLVFTGTDASESFDITAADDALNEAAEQFTLALSIASGDMAAATAEGGTILPGAITVAIADGDPITATLSGGGSVMEGSNAVVTVALTGGTPTAAVVLNYTLGADTDNATVDADLTADLTDSGSGTFTIATTDTAPHMFRIAITNDAINEAPEVFLVNAGTVTSAGAISTAGSPQTFTIDDGDDITVNIAAPNPATVSEGASVDFAITLSGATSGSVAGITVNYTASGTTDTPTDANSGSISIAAGQTMGTITLSIPFSAALDDNSPTETLRVALGAITVGAGGGVAEAAVSPSNAASVTVSYLPAAHSFAFTSPATSLSEGAAATTYTVDRTGPAIGGGGSITLTWAYAAGNPAPAAADFVGGAVPAGGTLVFTGTDASETFMVPAIEDDNLNEAAEQFTLALSIASGDMAAANAAGGADLPGAVTVTIADNDAITATLSGGGTVTEGSNAVVTVTLSGGAATAATQLRYALGGTAATTDVDAVAADWDDSTDGGSISIPMGTTSQTITVGIRDDDLNEPEEMLTLSIGDSDASSTGVVTTASSPQTFTITDGDPISVRIAVSGTDADLGTAGHQVEEGRAATFLVTLSAASAEQVTVPYTITNTGAGNVDAADYTDSGSGTLMIAANNTSGTISISLAEDADMDSEDLTVTLAATGYMAAGSIERSSTPSEQSAIAKVITRRSVRTLTLSPAAAGPYAEGDTNTTRTFYVDFEPGGIAFSGNTDVTWTITPGATNPTEAADFTDITGSVRIAAGSMARVSFAITIAGDNLNEASENFSIGITAPDSETDVGAALQLAITDDDAITYSISGGGSVAEAGGSASFAIALSGASEGAVTIPFTLGGTAQCAAASDMNRDCTTPSPLSVTVAAGATSQNLPIPIHNDSVNEADETLIVTLSATPGLGAGAGAVTRTATPAMQSATATIADNDGIRVRLDRTAPTVKEGDTSRFTVVVYSMGVADVARSADVQVTYSIAGSRDSPASASDYRNDTTGGTASGGTLTIPANLQNANIVLSILSDNSQEGAETLSVTITAASSAGAVNLGGPSILYVVSQEITIPANAQYAYTVAVSDPSGELTEPAVVSATTDKAVFTLSVTQDSGSEAARSGNAMIAYTIGGTAASADYTAPAGYTASTRSGSVSLAEGADSVMVTFPIAADTLNEGGETIIFTMGAITGAAAGNLGPAASTADRSATATIGANDRLQIILLRETATFNEGETATFSVRLQPLIGAITTSTNFTLPYTLSGVEAADVSGETGSGLVTGTLGGTLEIAAGTSTGNIVIRAVADNLNEAAENMRLSVACDAPNTAGPIEFPSPMCTGGIETVTLAPSAIGASDPITITIAAPAADSVREGSDAVFTVTLSGASEGSEGMITLPYSVADFTQANSGAANTGSADASPNPDIEGGAAGGGLSGQNIQIAAGTVSAMIRIPLNQDGLAEGAEIFSVSLGAPVAGSGAGAVSLGATTTASATIPANAAFTRFLSVAIGAEDSTERTAEVAEGATAQFQVKLEGDAPDSGVPVTVDWRISGTAESADHRCGAQDTLSFSAVETQTINCAISADGLNEAAETLVFTLSNPSGGGAGSAGLRGTAEATATANIPASDPITYRITGPAGVFTEGAMSQGMALTADFSVSLSGRSEGEVVIPFEVDSSTQTGGTAQGGVSSDGARDFTTPSPLSVTIAAGQTSGAIAIEVHNDRMNEANETIVLALLPETHGSFSKGAEAGAVTRIATAAAQRATAAIADDAADALVLSIARASGTAAQVSEGQSAVFEVSIPSGPNDPVSSAALCVPYTVNGNGISAGDYTDNTPLAAQAPCMGMLRIAAGSSTGRITIAIEPDGTQEPAETLRVTLGNPTSAGAVRVGNRMAEVEIPANAAAAHIVSISAAAARVAEGANAMFNLSVADAISPRTQSIAVTYEIHSSSTAAAGDYTAPYAGASGMLSIATGAASAQIAVPVTDDLLNEGDETLVLRLLSATGGSVHQSAVGTATATVTLIASDPLTAVLSRSDSGDLTEGGTGGAESAMLRISLSGGQLSADVTLPWRITGAVTAADLSASANAGRVTGTLGGTVTIAQTANPAEITLTLSAVADNLNEAAEMFALALLDEAGARPGSAGVVSVSRTPGQASAAMRLAASDPITVSIAAPASASLREGQAAVFTVTLSGASAGSAAAVTIPWSAQITAQRNADGAPNTDSLPDFRFLPAAGNPVPANAAGVLAAQQLVLSAGQTSAELRLEALFDNLDEGTTGEELTLSLQAPTAASGGGAVALAAAAASRSAAVNIVNVNALRTLAVSAPAPVAESDDIVFEVELAGMPPEQEFSVPWTLVPESASGPAAASGLARGIGRNHGVAHPNDPDIGMPSVSSGAVTGPVSGTLLFPAGSLNAQSVTVPTLQDPLNEGRESLRLELGPVPETAGGGGGSGIPATQVVARRASAEIAPSDPIMVSITRESSALVDGGVAVYRVSFGCADNSAGSAEGCIPIVATTAVRVTYTWTINGNSMQDDVTLLRGSTEGEIIVPMMATANVADDDIVELTVNLDNAEAVDPGGTPLPDVMVPDGTQIVTQIADWTLELTPNGGQVFEGSTLILTATLNGSSNLNSALEIRWMAAASGSNAAQGAEPADFANEDGAELEHFPDGRFEFASGAVPGSTRSFRIRIRADGESNEAGRQNQPERFRVTLMRVSGSTGVAVDTQPAEFTIAARQSAELAQRRGARLRTLLGVLDRSSAQLATDVISARMARSSGPPPWGSLSLAGRELLRGGAADGAAADVEGAGFGTAADGIGLALYGAAGRGGTGGIGAASGSGAPGAAGALGAPGAAAFGGLGAGLSQNANLWQGSALPSLAELLNGSSFNARSEGIAPNWTGITGVVIWGAGGATQLEGTPLRGERTLSYDGENYAGFLGMESMMGKSLLAGVALGYSGGELDFNESAAAGAGASDAAMRGSVESQRWSVHPYMGWWLTPTLQTWMVLGWGTGDTVIEEREATVDTETHRRAEGGSSMWMASGGASGNLPLGRYVDLALRVSATRVHSELEATSFADITTGTAVGGVLLPKLRTRSLRLGGEAEISSLLALGGDLRLRPFASAELHMDRGDDVTRDETRNREVAFDVGGGLMLTWPSRGLDLRLEGSAQVNDTGHEENRLSLDLGYDRGADARGFTLALQSALAQTALQSGWPTGAPQSAPGGGFGTGGFGAGGSGFGANRGSSIGGSGIGGGAVTAGGGIGDAGQHSLSGELAYGAALHPFGHPGLLTPYAAFSLGTQRRYATGLRFQSPGGLKIRLEGATEATSTPNHQLRLNIELPF